MAKVSVQVVVDRQQVDKLETDLDKLNGSKINIGTKEFTRDLQDAGRAAGELQGKLTKTVDVWTDGKQVKAVREYKNGIAETTRETTKLVGKNKDVVQTQTQITHNIEKEEAAQRKATQATQEGNAAVKQQGLLYDILGRSLTSFIARMTAYRAVYAGIRAITSGFREALETMKAVDDEMVAVRKVTGFDSYQMAAIENESYRVATKYGANASDYMEGVAEFARAGYLDLSGALAELSQKTQIVGDTTAEVANQFLLSVDKAYRFEGSISKLSAVLDGADIINNKYATSVEKIAEGLGIVAPVAAQMHVGVDELTAALGTITAVTQRSGSEAARALRAIFLNIVGDTKTEIEEGVTWTTGEIAGLQDVIKTYAKDAYDAAQATGSIIDPMEAIRGLSESMKDGLLTEQKLMDMVSDIGGKLRTSQLIALIQNFDMYESMLQDYANSAGTVDREVENAMDSWSRKTEVLKNTWTQFVKTGLNSSFFKGALDALTAFVERLGTLPGLLTRIAPLLIGLKLREVAKNMNASAKAASAMADGMKEAGAASASLNWVSAALIAISIAWNAVSYAIEDAKIKHQEVVKAAYEEADAAQESSDKIIELYSEMETATAGTDEFRSAASELADVLGIDIPAGADAAIQKIKEYASAQLALNAARTNEAKNLAQEEFVSSVGGAYKIDINSAEIGGYNDILAAMAPDLAKQIQGIAAGYTGGENYNNIENARAYREAIVQIVDAIELYSLKNADSQVRTTEYYKTLKEFLVQTEDAYSDLAEKEQEAFDTKIAYEFANALEKIPAENLNSFVSTISASKDYTNEEKEALIDLARQFFKVAEASDETTEALDEQTDAIEEAVTAADRLKQANEAAEAAARKLIPALFDENGALNATGVFALEADENLAGLVKTELEAELAAKKANYSALVAQLAVVGITASEAAQQIWQISRALAGDVPSMTGMFAGAFYAAGGGSDVKAVLAAKMAEINRLASQVAAVSAYAPSSGGSSSGGSSGGRSGGSGGKSSSSTSTEDKKLTSLKERVSLLKSELSLMKERGDSEEDQIAKMREIQNALKAEWEYLEKIKGDKATINGLEQEWWQYENSITDMMEKQAKSAQEQADALQKALDAQIALNNALRDRSVRYYNASTGQWEWGANQENVDSARKALEDAVSAAGMSMTQWGLKYSMLSFENSKDSWLNGGVPSFAWGIPGMNRNGITNNTLGTNNYGATYNIAGVNLTEAQARSMTVYDLAMLSGRLAAYS